MLRRLARATSDVLLSLRKSLPAAVVWAEAPPYSRGRVYVDQLEIGDPVAVVHAHGEFELVKRSITRAVAPPEDILVGLGRYHAGGLETADLAMITRDSHDDGALDEPVSADEDRRYISLPPIIARLLYYLVRESSAQRCLELGTAHGVRAALVGRTRSGRRADYGGGRSGSA